MLRRFMMPIILTIAVLVLGFGTLNAFATPGGGEGHGASAHADETAPADSAPVTLVTPPGRVTGESRPGLGCGDDNHTHTGAPGNPDKTCRSSGD